MLPSENMTIDQSVLHLGGKPNLLESAVRLLVSVKAKRESVPPNLAARAATRACAFLLNCNLWSSYNPSSRKPGSALVMSSTMEAAERGGLRGMMII